MSEIPVPMTLSPDCAYGKHRACHGDAWDAAADAVTACTCECHSIERNAATESFSTVPSVVVQFDHENRSERRTQ